MQVKDIHASSNATYAYLWTIEGVRYAFTSHHALAGSGPGSWIGTSFGDRVVKPGLIPPERMSMGRLEPWAAEVEDRLVTIRVVDLDQSLARIFTRRHRDQEIVGYMGQALPPSVDPAPAMVVGQGQTPLPLHGNHVGLECIGPNGERLHYWLAPGDKPAGYDHPAVPEQLITPGPETWTNRRCALWRLVQDPDTGEWASWDEQYAGGSLIWFGAMRDFGGWEMTDDHGPVFSFSCFGPWSHTCRSFNALRPSKPMHPLHAVQLTEAESGVAMWIGMPELHEHLVDGDKYLVETKYNAAIFHPDHSLFGLNTTEIREKLADILRVMISGVASGDVAGDTTYRLGEADRFWQDAPFVQERNASWSSPDTIKVRMENGSAEALYFELCITLHAKVWAALGWDVHAQPGFYKMTGSVPFYEPWNKPPGAELVPGPGYFRGRFPTHQLGVEVPNAKKDGQGQWVFHRAMWKLGTVILDPSTRQLLRLGVGEVHTRGQLAAIFGLSEIGGTPCDAAGWWLFDGIRLDPGDEEPRPYQQVALCSWITGSQGGIGVAGDGYAQLRVERWEDPRVWGFDCDRMTTPWVCEPESLRMIPLAVAGGLESPDPDHAHMLWSRWLLSSGTAQWTGEQLVPGVNQPAELQGSEAWGGDLEVADLGCNIPPAWVDARAAFRLAASSALPGGVNSPLNRVHYGILGTRPSKELWRELLGGRGWAWSLLRDEASGALRFGLFDPITPGAGAGETLTITDADMHGWGRVEQRDGGPYDRFRFEVGRNLLTRDYDYELDIPSLDPSVHLRHGQLAWPVKDGGLRKPTHFPGQAAMFSWEEAARTRFAGSFGRFHAQPVFILHLAIKAHLAHRLGTGQQVHVEAQHIPNAEGGYGIDHYGFVYEIEHLLTGPFAGAVALHLMMQPRSAEQQRCWGPAAYGYRFDPLTSKLEISRNWAKRNKPGWCDTIGFTKPAFASKYPDSPLRVAVFQSEDGKDGKTYPPGLMVWADVVAADSTSSPPTLTLANLEENAPGNPWGKGPKIYRDMLKWVVGAPYRRQVPGGWAQKIYLYNTRPDGTFGDPPEGGFRL